MTFNILTDTMECSVRRAAEIVGKKWSILILIELHKGENKQKRYNELKKKLPEITPKMLSGRLKELEKEGLIEKRIDTSSFPIKCLYSLTNSGEAFIEIIKEMKSWSLKYVSKNKHCKTHDCKECVF